MDYFEATVPGLAESRCPLTLRRKKLYTQRRRGQCHIRKSSWRLPISIPLPTCREAKSKTKIVDGHAHYTLKANHRLTAVGMQKTASESPRAFLRHVNYRFYHACLNRLTMHSVQILPESRFFFNYIDRSLEAFH